MTTFKSMPMIRRTLPLVLSLLAGMASAATPAPSAPAAAPAASSAASAAAYNARMSYATGVQVVRNFKKNDIPFDFDQLVKGMHDAMAGGDLAMTEKDIRLALNQLQVDLRRNMATNQRALADKNRTRGTDFMAAFKAKPEVKVLGNGVAYRVIQKGAGTKPSENDTVIVKYRGTSTDGVEFDATEDGKTALLKLNQLVMGWRTALTEMPVGAKWEIVIPPNLAYGEKGVGTSIGPNETLVFEIELVGIKPQN